MEQKPVVDTLRKRLSQMDDVRENWRTHWRELQEYILPEHGIGLSGDGETDQTKGGKVRSVIIDNTAGRAVNVLAAGMLSGLTSPSRPWFRLTLADSILAKDHAVRLWLAQVEESIRHYLNRSNVYRALHQCYQEIGVFGTAAQMVLEDSETGIYCRPFTVGEYWLGVNHKLMVDTFYRSYWANARQLVEEFGEQNVSDAVKFAYERDHLSKLFEVIHAIEPNDKTIKAAGANGKKYRSIYFERNAQAEKLLRVHGFEEFPVQAPRWLVVGGRIYGACPGMETLGDIKMLQKINEKQLINLDKAMEPPLKAPSSLQHDVINSIPGGITYTDELSNRDNLSPLYSVPIAINEAEAKIMNVQERIQRGFFTDLFLMLANQPTRSNVTATEIAERHEEKLLMLGPVLERLEGELLDPLIERTFAILLRGEALPPPPPILGGRLLDIEYVSILAQAQKLVGVTGIQQFSGFVGSLAAVRPEVLDKVDFDVMIDEYAEIVGVPPKMILPPEAVAQARAERARLQQMQTAMAVSQQMAEGAKTLSQSDLDGNNALSVLTGRQQGITPAPN